MRVFAVTALLILGLGGVPPASLPRVEVVALPDGGIQPQAVVDAAGTIHIVYFAGPPGSGDLFYVTRGAGATAFSRPIRVNSEPGSAIATGSVRGGQIAVGRSGWIHVAWNASRPIERRGVKVTPMWYARLDPAKRIFEPQRAIGTNTRHLDGGGSVAADARGAVYVSWHAAGSEDGETNRRVYVAVSRSDGAQFDPDTIVADSGGVCGCCALRSLVDARGHLQLLYRAATDGIHRDAMWLSATGAAPAGAVKLHTWDLPACPMTTFSMANAGSRILAAWETAQQIYLAELDPVQKTFAAPAAVAGAAVRKHPSVAVNAAGDRLIAWTEGTAWARGGTLAWQLQDPTGKVLTAAANAGPVPVWGLVAAIARRDGSFLVVR
jgi:hypothetical protein